MTPGMKLHDWDTNDYYLICKVYDDGSVDAINQYFEQKHITYAEIYKQMNLIDDNPTDMNKLIEFLKG